MGSGFASSTYWFGAGPGTGAQGSRPPCTAWAGAKAQALQIKTGAQGSGSISHWHSYFASIYSRWKKEYRESRDVFGSASAHKLHVRLFSGTGTAWHRRDVCVCSGKSSFPPKRRSSTQTTCWEWFLNCTNLRSWGGRGCNIIWSPGKY